MDERRGVWVQMAAFCEKVLEDKDGVLSLIRVVDRFFVPDLPEEVHPEGATGLQTFAVIAFKSDGPFGPARLEMHHRPPGGPQLQMKPVDIHMRGGVEGAQLRAELILPLTRESIGTHWFDVVIDGRILTRLTLEVQLRPGSGEQAAAEGGAGAAATQ